MTSLVLASRSPQRRAILEQLGVRFEVIAPDVEELELGDPAEIAVENARRKASAVAANVPVVGVDTVVALDGLSYGKPADEEDVWETLRILSGRVHEVVGGLCVVEPRGELRVRAVTTRVRFRKLAPDLIDWYVASGEWRERAGSYAIQGRGAALVAGIEGDYLNVVGLPVVALLELLPGILRS